MTELPDPVVTMTGFARALRANGVAADPSRLAAAAAAPHHVDALDAEQGYWTGRVPLCAEPDDLPRYDAVFDSWFRGRLPAPPGPPPPNRPGQVLQLRPLGGGRDDPAADEVDEEDDALRTAASDTEVLRHRDVGAMTDVERAEINALIALLSPRVG